MEHSNYQVAIYKAAETTIDNMLIDAVAGSGKTTVLVELSKILKGRTLFCAFNKHIADELKKRVPSTTQVATLNAFGWRICLENATPKLEKDKTFIFYKREFDLNDPKDKKDFWSSQAAAQQLISLLRAHLIYEPTNADLDALAAKYSIDFPETDKIYNAIHRTFRLCINDTYLMDFDDQIFMPLYNNWAIPQYDNVLVDEAQDLSPFNQEIVIRAGKRIIVVGDTRQAIYGFRGADPESMKNMQERLNATVLPLSICYRCPKSVVQQAQQIVPHIECSPTAQEGIVQDIKSEDFRRKAISDDYVLCRITAPLVSECLRMIREGRKATVKGRDIGKSLETLIDKIYQGNDLIAFNEKLDSYAAEQIARLGRLNKEAEIIALMDRVDTLKVFIESCDTVKGIKEKIAQIFSDFVSGIVFCTVHKSKGLEAKRIYILEPGMMPHPMAKLPWQKVQESNLKYVAITRSKSELYFIR